MITQVARIAPDCRDHRTLKGEVVEDLSPSGSVAYGGTTLILKDTKGQHWVIEHSGSSVQRTPTAYKIHPSKIDQLKKELM